jgi:hypothetical protein
MNTSKRLLGILLGLLVGTGLRAAGLLKYAALPAALIGGGAWGIYAYRDAISQVVMQDVMDEKLVELILLSIKPRSNATDSELKQQAQLIAFRNAASQELLANPDERIRLKGRLMKNASSVFDFISSSLEKENIYKGTQQAEQWQQLFTVSTGKWRVLNAYVWLCPEAVKKTALDSIVESVQLGVQKPEEMTEEQAAQVKELAERRQKIKDLLHDRIECMTDEQFKNQCVPTVESQDGEGIIKGFIKRTGQQWYNARITKEAVLYAIDQADALIELFDSVR